jgi:hypothetical protein
MLLLLACAAPDAPAALPDVRPRLLVPDAGAFVDDVWVSTPEAPVAMRTADGRVAEDGVVVLGPGVVHIQVERVCGVVTVRVDVAGDVVSLPYPSCGGPASTGLDRQERTRADLLRLQSVGILTELVVPEGPDDAPAAWLTRDEAEVVCGFWGGRLPTVDAWRSTAGANAGVLSDGPSARGDLDRAPSVGAGGHEDLWGNVAEWLAGRGSWGEAAGGSWLRRGEVWRVPAEARSEEIGFRCWF